MISDSLIDQFRAYQKQHVLDLSRSVTLGFGNTIEEDCPNCTYDQVGGTSGATFTDFTGSVTLFSGTPYERIFEARSFRQKCPVCGGKGFFSIPNEIIIQAHVHWDTRSSDTYPNSPAGWSGQNQVKIKTDSTHYDDFLRAKYFIVDGVRVEPSSTPVVRAMKTNDGIVEIWCKTVEIGKETRR